MDICSYRNRWNHDPRNLSLANMLNCNDMYQLYIRYIFFVFELAKAFRLACLGLGSKQKLQTNFHCKDFQLTWTDLCSKRDVHAGFYVRYSSHLKLESPKTNRQTTGTQLVFHLSRNLANNGPVHIVTIEHIC